MIELQMIEINFIKKAIFFILRRLFRRLFQKKVHFLSSPVVIPVVISKKGPFFYPPVVIPVVISKKGPFFLSSGGYSGGYFKKRSVFLSSGGYSGGYSKKCPGGPLGPRVARCSLRSQTFARPFSLLLLVIAPFFNFDHLLFEHLQFLFS